MPDCLAAGFVGGVVAQILAFGALCFVPGRLPSGVVRALLAAAAAPVIVHAAHDADYTLLAGELLLLAAGWRMAGAVRSDAGKGRS